MSEGSGRLECSACCNNIMPKTQFSSNQRKKSATRRKCLECDKSSPVQSRRAVISRRLRQIQPGFSDKELAEAMEPGEKQVLFEEGRIRYTYKAVHRLHYNKGSCRYRCIQDRTNTGHMSD
jgi:hypothetical protein